MDKVKADRLITVYLQKLYGFAMKKAFSYAEAEELCAEITKEVYHALLKADHIANIEGYIWQISEHTYSKYVASKKRHEGISLNGMILPFYDDLTAPETEEELAELRREIAFLTQKRRRIVYLFYYENKTVSFISRALDISEGTVKWHLNKARHELKEGFSMKRTIGTLGLSPVSPDNISHSGRPGQNGGPEYYLDDKLNLNIVYSVYFEPKTDVQIAEELGITPVFIEDKIALLEENGFLVRKSDGTLTTYVEFLPRTYSKEKQHNRMTVQQEIAKTLVNEYVPLVREALKDVTDVYIPGGNRELFEAAMIFYAVSERFQIRSGKDLSRYYIKTTDGGEYITYIRLDMTCADPEFVSPFDAKVYRTCGAMQRSSDKYPSVWSWSVDSRLDCRKGTWQNNLYTDYEYLYEFMCGMLGDSPANADKFARLKERRFLNDNNKVNIMIVKSNTSELFDRLPPLSDTVKARFADYILEQAMLEAKAYPPQMQDLVIDEEMWTFIGNIVPLMVLDILYENGTFRPLTDNEKVTANLLMFADRLPE